MSTSVTTEQRAQAGFTLVELAIVLVIIGLLIGGILKGQELVGATRINSTVSQVKAIETASNTFLDTYGSLPGDLADADKRIAGCAGKPCLPTGGTFGDSKLDNSADDPMASGDSNMAFFNQLLKADLLSGFSGADDVAIGGGVMGASLGQSNHFRAGYNATAPAGSLATSWQAGNYVVLTAEDTATGITDSSEGQTPKQSEGIDRKYDDGRSTTGSVIGEGKDGADECSDTGTYNTALTDKKCGLYVRIAQ